MISDQSKKTSVFETAEGGEIAIDVSRNFMRPIIWDSALRKLPWRSIRGSDDLVHATKLAWSGSPSRFRLAEGCSVPLAKAVDIQSPQGAAFEIAKALTWRREYWAAEIDVVAIPRATYFPSANLIVNDGAYVWEELEYTTDMRSTGLFKEGDGPLTLRPAYQKMALEAPLIAGVTWICGCRYYRNYTHWHTEVLSQLMDLDVQLPNPTRFAFQSLDEGRRTSLLATRRVKRSDIVLADKAYHFEIALVATQSLFRTWLHPAIAAPLRALASEMVSQSVPSRRPRRPVYISRLDAGARPMTNETDLCAALEAVGVKIVTASETSYKEQVAIFSSASLLIGPHGSGLTNMIYCPKGTPVIELRATHASGRSPLWDGSYRMLSSIMGIPYGVMVFENPVDTDPWQVDIPLVLATLAKFDLGA